MRKIYSFKTQQKQQQQRKKKFIKIQLYSLVKEFSNKRAFEQKTTTI